MNGSEKGEKWRKGAKDMGFLMSFLLLFSQEIHDS